MLYAAHPSRRSFVALISTFIEVLSFFHFFAPLLVSFSSHSFFVACIMSCCRCHSCCCCCCCAHFNNNLLLLSCSSLFVKWRNLPSQFACLLTIQLTGKWGVGVGKGRGRRWVGDALLEQHQHILICCCSLTTAM